MNRVFYSVGNYFEHNANKPTPTASFSSESDHKEKCLQLAK